MLSGILWVCLLQSERVQQMDLYTGAIEAQAKAFEKGKQLMAEGQKQRFEEKFNKLVEALHQFSEAYNKHKGAVWPSKQAEALKKAFRELEQTTSWPKEKVQRASIATN